MRHEEVHKSIKCIAMRNGKELRLRPDRFNSNWVFDSLKNLSTPLFLTSHTLNTSFLFLWNVTVRSDFIILICVYSKTMNLFQLCTLFIALLKSCFSTSAFRNVHFLLDLCRAWKKTHPSLFFSANPHSFPLRYACTLHCCTALFLCLFSDVTLAPIHANVFTLSICCPFKIWA